MYFAHQLSIHVAYANNQDTTDGAQILIQIPPNDVESYQVLLATLQATIINLNKKEDMANDITTYS